MSDEREIWIRQSYYLLLFTSLFHSLQFGAGLSLAVRSESAALSVFALDAVVGAFASWVLAFRIRRYGALDVRSIQEGWRFRFVAYGYFAVTVAALLLGVLAFWSARRPGNSVFGIALAAVSMLTIPIIGSYMKTLAVELRSRGLKSAAVFTFGNSYLSLVLLMSLLLNAGMDYGWGDALGALVMFPFIAQKGIQTLLEEGKYEYVED